VNDIRRRAPFYGSDWTDAWDYRVVPATVYMYFAKYVNINIQILHNVHPNMSVVLIEGVVVQYPACFGFLA
jgi:hypothetical protein